MRKLSTVMAAGVCLLAMFACKPDKSFQAGFGGKYFIQTDSIKNGDTIAYFAPYFIVEANRMLRSYNLSSVLHDEAGNVADTLYYPLLWRSISSNGVYTYFSDISNRNYPRVTADKVTAGPYSLRVYDTSGELFRNQGYFENLDTKPLLGEVKVTHYAYYAGQYIMVRFEAVKGADEYVLVVSPEDNPQYRTLMSADFDSDSNGLLGLRTNKFNQFADGQKLYIRVAAHNGNRVIRESAVNISLTVGKDSMDDF